MPLEIDDLTILLALLLALLLYSLLSRPAPLVHPLLLGTQAEVSAVRKEGEMGGVSGFCEGSGRAGEWESQSVLG
jgi:long-chain acyl-CoA synthetase